MENKYHMKIKKLSPEINTATLYDGRGGIFTYYPTDPIVEWNFVVTFKGQVRGNHYHKEFDEYMTFTEGHGIMISEQIDCMNVSTGDCIFIPKGTTHTFIPLSDCKMITMITKKWNDCDEPVTPSA